MTAKEMFEELNYKKTEIDKTSFEFVKKVIVDGFGFENVCIQFNKIYKGVYIYGRHEEEFSHEGAVGIYAKELKAIQKQIEELGWNNDK